MADKAKGWTIIWTLLFSGLLRYSNEEECQRLAHEKSTPVVSFCKEDILMSNTSMTLDAFQPYFGGTSTTCTCEVSTFTTQNTSVLHIRQEPSLLPTSTCGLSVNLTWGTQNSRVVNCNDFLDSEYQLPQGVGLMLTLSSTSPNWSTGFCLTVRLRFESGLLSAKCFAPGKSTFQAMSTPSVTEITGQHTNSTSTGFSVFPETDQVSIGTGTTEQKATTSNHDGNEILLTSETTEEVEVTTKYASSSTTERKTDTSVAQKADHSTDLKVVYILVALLVSIILGVLIFLVFLRRRHQRTTRERLNFKNCIQSSGISSSNGADTSSLDMNIKDTNYAYENMKEEPTFYYYQDLKVSTKSSSDAAERLTEAKVKQRPPGLFQSDNEHTRVQDRHDRQKVPILHNTPHVNKDVSSVVNVTVNGSKKFIL